MKQDIVLKSESDFVDDKVMHDDNRGKKIAMVCHCLLNSNSKVLERARYSGMCSKVVEVLDKYGIGIIQLPCPEVLHFGCNRYWGGKNVFENASYRRFCREQSQIMSDYIENYQKLDYNIVCILGCDGSPTCGVNFTNHYNNGGGRPKTIDREVIPGKGIFMEEFEKEMIRRKLIKPKMYGLGMDLCSKSIEEIFDDFNEFISREV